MKAYRILKKEKEGFYKIYTVQERQLLFFWVDLRPFDDLAEATAWVYQHKVAEVTIVETILK